MWDTLRTLLGGLVSEPVAIVMIVSNLMLLGYVWYTAVENHQAWAENNARRAELGREVLAYAARTNDLLSRCVVPEKR